MIFWTFWTIFDQCDNGNVSDNGMATKSSISHTDVIYAASIFPLLNYDFSQKFEWL